MSASTAASFSGWHASFSGCLFSSNTPSSFRFCERCSPESVADMGSNQTPSYTGESHHYKATRLRFGTWNKAIKAAGFKPHQVLFAKKYIANDGHKCDSLAEKIIDDWLTARKIPHQKNVFYPNSKYTTDFKVRGTFIEFFGLQGELRIYDQYMRKKLRLIRNNNLSLISIYPKDLFPKSKLDYVLKDLIK